MEPKQPDLELQKTCENDYIQQFFAAISNKANDYAEFQEKPRGGGSRQANGPPNFCQGYW